MPRQHQQFNSITDLPETRVSGTVIKWMPEKGFGFILGPDGVEYFFHRTALRNPAILNELHPAGSGSKGTPVTFQLSSTEKGPRAEDVDLA